MITHNFEDFPDHRRFFFELLEAVTEQAFSALIQLDCSLIVNSLVWAFKHLDRGVIILSFVFLHRAFHLMSSSLMLSRLLTAVSAHF